MTNVRPFHGIRYNVEITGELSSVITPPYDVITPEQQASYYRRSPYNIIRLEFGQGFPGDTSGNRYNRYSRAAKTLNDWLRDGVLVREQHPAFYITEHCFPYEDSIRSFWGVIAAVRLEDLGAGRIRPTETTMKEPAIDRLNLIRACRANLSPIMGIFNHDQRGSLQSVLPRLDDPTFTAVDDLGVTFNVWVVSEAETVGRITEFLAGRVIYIADGHHRYETALTYRDECFAAHSGTLGDEAFNFVMMTLIDSQDPGLVVMPYHRQVRGIDPETLTKLKGRLSEHFQIRELPRYSSEVSENLRHWMAALKKAGDSGTAFGLYGLADSRFYLLTPGEESVLHNILPDDKPATWRNLDVNLLHWVILRGMLGIDGPEGEKECLEYSPHGEEVLRKVDTGIAQLAFFLNPVPIPSILAIADAGMRMPPKSTYFYPKTPAGLVINPLL
jgi:uncharacterized protein (DUF1015 family)